MSLQWGDFGYPLIQSRDVNKRLDVVQEIYDYSESKAIGALLELLSNLPDLEKGLCRIQYGSVRPSISLPLQVLIANTVHATGTV